MIIIIKMIKFGASVGYFNPHINNQITLTLLVGPVFDSSSRHEKK